MERRKSDEFVYVQTEDKRGKGKKKKMEKGGTMERGKRMKREINNDGERRRNEDRKRMEKKTFQSTPFHICVYF